MTSNYIQHYESMYCHTGHSKSWKKLNDSCQMFIVFFLCVIFGNKSKGNYDIDLLI